MFLLSNRANFDGWFCRKQIDFSGHAQSADIYAIAAFCYRALTGREHNPSHSLLPGDIRPELQPWDAVLDPALRKNPARRPKSFQEWRQIQPRSAVAASSPTAPLPIPAPLHVPSVTEAAPKTERKPRIKRRWIVWGMVFLGLIYLGRTYAPSLMRNIPVVNLVAPSYQRGTGSYVVRYADRSYDNAKWKVVWSTENVNGGISLGAISGWDKNNFVISGHGDKFVSLKDGHWIVHDLGQYSYSNNRAHYLTADRFIIALWKDARVYHKSGYHEYSLDSVKDFWIHQPEDGLLYITGDNGGNLVNEYANNKMAVVRKDAKKYSIWRENNTNTQHSIANIRSVHSYKNGQAIGYRRNKILEYKNGLWYTYLDTNHSGDVYCLWAIDNKNFLLAGNGITQFVDGVQSHPTVTVSGWVFTGSWLAGWGVSMDKYWVMDKKGNVAQFDHEQCRGVVRGPKLEEREQFQDAWVSPEGTVYAITDKEVYRLD